MSNNTTRFAPPPSRAPSVFAEDTTYNSFNQQNRASYVRTNNGAPQYVTMPRQQPQHPQQQMYFTQFPTAPGGYPNMHGQMMPMQMAAQSMQNPAQSIPYRQPPPMQAGYSNTYPQHIAYNQGVQPMAYYMQQQPFYQPHMQHQGAVQVSTPQPMGNNAPILTPTQQPQPAVAYPVQLSQTSNIPRPHHGTHSQEMHVLPSNIPMPHQTHMGISQPAVPLLNESVRRVSKRLQIVDPNTNKEVNIVGDAPSSSQPASHSLLPPNLIGSNDIITPEAQGFSASIKTATPPNYLESINEGTPIQVPNSFHRLKTVSTSEEVQNNFRTGVYKTLEPNISQSLSVNSAEFVPRQESSVVNVSHTETTNEIESNSVLGSSEVLDAPNSLNASLQSTPTVELTTQNESEAKTSITETVSIVDKIDEVTLSTESERQTLASDMIDVFEINGHVSESTNHLKEDSEKDYGNETSSDDESSSNSEKRQYNFKSEPYESVNALRDRKMKYDREFLYSLRTSDFAKNRPANLPCDVPDIMPSGISNSAVMDGSTRDMMPAWLKSTGYIKPAVVTPRGRDSGKRDAKYGGSGNGGHSSRALDSRNNFNKQTQKIIEVKRDKVELHKAEQAYKITNKRTKNAEDGLSEESELERSIRANLNKITPQNFETCFEQIMRLNIDTPNGLNVLIKVLFEKATLEESYAVTFAKLCKQLSFLKVEIPLNEGDDTATQKYIGFRSLLLQKCQQTFETKLVDLMENEAQKWDVKINAETDEKKKLQLEEYKAEKIKKEKDRYYGNIKFIGELFIHDLLTSNIIHKCVFDLLQSCDSENLECLCKLLTTVGHKLETNEPKIKDKMDKYFDKINNYIEKKSQVEARIRCKLMDIREMRKNEWQLRERQKMREVKPMTKEEFKMAEKQMQQQKDIETQQLQQAKRNDRTGRGHPTLVPAATKDGWTTIPSRTRNTKMEPTKMVLKQCSDPRTDISLGPGGAKFNQWKAGAGKNLQRPELGSGGSSGTASPRSHFAVQGRSGSLQNSRESSRSRDESPRTLQSGGGNSNKTSLSRERDANRDDPDEIHPLQPTLTAEKFKAKSLGLLTEFMHTDKEEDALFYFKELENEPNVHDFVIHVVEKGLEGKKDFRIKSGQLFLLLLQNNKIKASTIVSGFHPLLEAAEDILIDTPDLWNYLAEFLYPLVHKNVSLSFMRDLLAPLIGTEQRAAHILARTLHLAANDVGHDVVGDVFRKSGLNWSRDFLNNENENDFLSNKHLEWTVTEVPLSPQMVDPKDLQARLVNALSLDVSNEEIYSFVEKEVPRQLLLTEAFVHDLVYALVCNAFVNGKFHSEAIKIRQSILIKYLDMRLNLELCTLEAAREVISERGNLSDLKRLFDTFLDSDLITEETFIAWRDLQKEGTDLVNHREAVASLTNFFDFLTKSKLDCE